MLVVSNLRSEFDKLGKLLSGTQVKQSHTDMWGDCLIWSAWYEKKNLPNPSFALKPRRVR
jgi:hypothetical protein